MASRIAAGIAAQADGNAVRLAERRDLAISRSTAGLRTEFSAATEPLSRAAAMTYCVRSFEPIEKKATSENSSGAMATDGTSTMMPSGGILCGMPAAASARASSAKRAAAFAYSSGTEIIGNITLRLPWTAARSSALICRRKISGRASDRRMPRRPRNGLVSSTVKPGTGLSPPASTVRMVTGFSPAHSSTFL